MKMDRQAEKIVLRDCPDVVSLALSPDGRWVAAGAGGKTQELKIWEVASGRLVNNGPADGVEGGSVRFSPDGQWLVKGKSGEYRFCKTGSWEPGPVIVRDRTEHWPGPLAFTPNSHLLALTSTLERVQLFDVVRQCEIATLSAPDAQPVNWLCFSPDGGQLAAAAENHAIQLWDLRLLWQELAEMGLDANLPPLPPAAEHDQLQPIRIQIRSSEADTNVK
jgi:WD40 repeat protein